MKNMKNMKNTPADALRLFPWVVHVSHVSHVFQVLPVLACVAAGGDADACTLPKIRRYFPATCDTGNSHPDDALVHGERKG